VIGAGRRQATTVARSIHATVEDAVRRVDDRRSRMSAEFVRVVAVRRHRRRVGDPTARLRQVRPPHSMVSFVDEVVDTAAL